MTGPQNSPSQRKRQKLQRDALVGFMATLAAFFVLQAIVNLFLPNPKVWPALLALINVIAAVCLWRWSRAHDREDSEGL
ncbi:hypothetical protein PAB09_03055 [Corynebacterium sp. SCR221107]|uniref:hypothetical protein n=1 Tax=Corynebacterium sp. SCR221107 TaxID=3017361 RepID=UPI0022EC2C08|nr:hypothetical protein [Corynebacterium sp. SCR221107]WBT09323.1 hypothetical protein PAB09_03055 [Corynebacterium sp. SCR221107]